MHKELKAVFEERKAPTHASAETINGELRSIMRTANLVQRQMSEYEALHLEAQLAPHDPMLDGSLGEIEQTFRAGDDAVKGFIAAGKRLALVMAQVERYLDRDETAILAALALQSKDAPAA